MIRLILIAFLLLAAPAAYGQVFTNLVTWPSRSEAVLETAELPIGPEYNPLPRMDCATAGQIRNDSGNCVSLDTYFSGQTILHVGAVQPYQTITAAIADAQANNVIVIHNGTYREGSLNWNVDGLVFMLYPGDVVRWTGAVTVNEGWTVHSGNVYKRPYVYDSGGALPTFNPDCPNSWAACNRHFQNRELLYFGGDLGDFHHELADLADHGDYYVNGTLTADHRSYTTPPDTIYAYLGEPSNLEFAVHEKLLKETGQNANCANGARSGLRIIGLTFEQATPTWAQGMVCTSQRGAIVEQSTFKNGGQKGLDVVGGQDLVRGVTVFGNGFTGMGGGADTTIIEYNLNELNGWRNTKANEVGQRLTGTGSGGGKWAKTVRDSIRYNIIRSNEGPGIWMDVNGSYNVGHGNLIHDNLARGIFDESGVDGDAHGGMHNNEWFNNIVSFTRYDAETDDGDGIKVYGAKYSKVYHNTVFQSGEQGITVESKAALADPSPKGAKIYNNLVYSNNTRNVGPLNEGVQVKMQDTTAHRLDGNIYQKGSFDTNGNVWRWTYSGASGNGDDLPSWQDHWQTTVAGTGCDACEANAQIPAASTQVVEDPDTESGYRPVFDGLAIDTAPLIPDSLVYGGTLPRDIFGTLRPAGEADVGAVERTGDDPTIDDFSVAVAPSTDAAGSTFAMTVNLGIGHELTYKDDDTGLAFNLTADTDASDSYLHDQVLPDPDTINVGATAVRITDGSQKDGTPDQVVVTEAINEGWVVGNTSQSANEGGTTSHSHTVATGSDILIALVTITSRNNSTPNAPTYGGVALTQAALIGSSNNFYPASSVWYLVNPAAGAGTLAASQTGSDPISLHAIDFAGVNTSDPLGAVSTQNGVNDDPASLVITTLVDNVLIVDAFGIRTNNGQTIVGAGLDQTEVGTPQHGSNTGGWASYREAGAAGAYTFEWDKSAPSSHAWAIQAFKPAP